MNLSQEKRVMLAFALSFVMLLLWRSFFMKEPPAPPNKAPSAPTAASAPGQPGAAPGAKTSQPTPPPAHPVALPVTEGSKAEEIVVENKLYRVTFSTVGAVVRSWVLKGYPKGEQVEIIDSAACEALGFPMSLSLADPTLKTQVNQAIYVAKAYSPQVVPAGQEPAEESGNTFSSPVTLAFTYSDGKIQVKKQFSFSETYSPKVEVSVFDGQHGLPMEVAWPGGFGDQSLSSAVTALTERAVFETADSGKVQEVTLTPSFLKRFLPSGGGVNGNELQQDVSGPLVLAGLEDRFFAGIFLPENPDVKLRINREVFTPPDWHGDENSKPKPLAVRLAAMNAEPLAFRLFVAPKELDLLKSVNPPLDSLVDFGWFSIVAKPLFLALHFIYDHWIHNYGWAIVLITLVINLAMFPLKLKSLKSAQEMQRIQPIIKGIQDKYKQYKFNDPRKQKMNEEVMKVYHEHHINPLGSCLPMLVQLPFLYGFYRVLDLSIELRHAPWIWWLKDLSAPDPYYILPISMVVTMFILQRMTPTPTVDPSQQRMMMIMPLMFGFIFFRLASGLNLYYATSNVIGLGQQFYINRKIRAKDPLLAPARKPAPAKE